MNERNIMAAIILAGRYPAHGSTFISDVDLSFLIRSSVEMTDAILKVTSLPCLPVPDANEWVVRVPTDPIPLHYDGVRFGDGSHIGGDYPWSKEAWTHTKGCGNDDLHITHYRPR